MKIKGRKNVNAGNLKHHLTDFKNVYIAQALFNGCFYGIRAIFVLYAINRFSLTQGKAIGFFATFMTLCYGTSLIGGYIADKGLGVKNTIMIGGAFSSLGLFLVLFPSKDLCFLGLALASLGSGYFKPNLLTAAGLHFENSKDPEKDRVCSILYIAMNVGSLIAPLICGFVGKTYGWHYGVVLIATVFMGATCFAYKTMEFHSSYKDDLTLSNGKVFWANLSLIILLYLLFRCRDYFHGLMGLITCGSIICLGKIYYQCNFSERKDILRIIAYILLFAISAALLEQAGTSLILFYNEAVDRQVMGTIISPSALLSLDPLFILLCGPLLLLLSGRYLEKTTPLNGFVKMGSGFLCVAAGFGILAYSTFQESGKGIPLVWIVGAIFIQIIGELWIAPVSFSNISQYAPSRYKSILMSFWSMAIAYGHYLAGFMAQFSLGGSIGSSSLLSYDNSFERYRAFFFHLALLALCVGLSLLLHQSIKYLIGITSERNNLSGIGKEKINI
jgi:proton-dependent oligopeptide transporter, POT family